MRETRKIPCVVSHRVPMYFDMCSRDKYGTFEVRTVEQRGNDWGETTDVALEKDLLGKCDGHMGFFCL